MNVCRICVASLSHHTLCMGNLFRYMLYVFHWLAKKKYYQKNKKNFKKSLTTLILKLETFFLGGGLIISHQN